MTLSVSTYFDLKVEQRLLEEGPGGGPSMLQTSGWWVRFPPEIHKFKKLPRSWKPPLGSPCAFIACVVRGFCFSRILKKPLIYTYIYLFVSSPSLNYLFSLGRKKKEELCSPIVISHSFIAPTLKVI